MSIKNAIIQARISCRRSNFVKIITSDIEIAITPSRIARLHLNLIQISSHYRRYTANVQGQR